MAEWDGRVRNVSEGYRRRGMYEGILRMGSRRRGECSLEEEKRVCNRAFGPHEVERPSCANWCIHVKKKERRGYMEREMG